MPTMRHSLPDRYDGIHFMSPDSASGIGAEPDLWNVTVRRPDSSEVVATVTHENMNEAMRRAACVASILDHSEQLADFSGTEPADHLQHLRETIRQQARTLSNLIDRPNDAAF